MNAKKIQEVTGIFHVILLDSIPLHFIQKLLWTRLYLVNRKTSKGYNLLQPFEVSNYNLLVISSTNNLQNCQLNVVSAA